MQGTQGGSVELQHSLADTSAPNETTLHTFVSPCGVPYIKYRLHVCWIWYWNAMHKGHNCSTTCNSNSVRDNYSTWYFTLSLHMQIVRH